MLLWITTGGKEVLDVVRDADRVAQTCGDFRPPVFQTYEVVAMYTNMPFTCVIFSKLVLDYHWTHHRHRSTGVIL